MRFYYDLVCPYSYLQSLAVEAGEREHGWEVEWLPLERRRPGVELPVPRGDHLGLDWRDYVYPLATRLGVEMHLPPVQPRATLPAAASLWAREQGALAPFRRHLYGAFYRDGLDISREDVIAAAARAASLPPTDAVAAAYDPRWLGLLAEIHADASAKGIEDVPALEREGELFVSYRQTEPALGHPGEAELAALGLSAERTLSGN